MNGSSEDVAVEQLGNSRVPKEHNEEPRESVAGFETVFCFAILHLMTEMRMELGLDPDGSLTPERINTVLGHWDAISGCADAPGAPFSPDSKDARKALREAIKRFGPVLSRMALAARAMG